MTHGHPGHAGDYANSPRALVEVVDYLLVTTDVRDGTLPAGADGSVPLQEGVRIECLEHDFSERLLDAAEPRGENWEATRQFGVVHAYVRTAWKEGDGPSPDGLYDWDHDGRLYPCVQLSRLVRDNAVGTEYAIRLLRHRDGGERLVPFAGYESHVAYRLHPEERGWLDRAGEPVAYEYDEGGRLTVVSSPSATVEYSYDTANRLTKLALPDGIVKHYAYDAAGELTAIEFDHEGEGLGAVYYSYDAEGQVDAVWGSLANLSMPSPFGPAEYDAANEMTSLEGAELEYDNAGDLISDGSSEYAWNARRQLIAVSGADAASFGYDPFGRRVSETVGGVSRELLYDGQNVIHESVEGGGSASLLTGFGADVNYARTSEGQTESVLTDRLDSTLGLADEEGEIQTSYSYSPFGVTTESGMESGNRMAFTGREASTGGLQYNRARYYDSGVGRFISPDPVGYELGQRVYAYGSDDPLDYVDPSGRISLNPIEDLKEGAEAIKGEVEAVVGDAKEAAEAVESAAKSVVNAAVDVGEWVVTHPGVVASVLAVAICTAADGVCTEAAVAAFISSVAEDGVQACSPMDFLRRFGITVAVGGVTGAAYGTISSIVESSELVPESVKAWFLRAFLAAPGGIVGVGEGGLQDSESPQGGSESSGSSGSC